LALALVSEDGQIDPAPVGVVGVDLEEAFIQAPQRRFKTRLLKRPGKRERSWLLSLRCQVVRELEAHLTSTVGAGVGGNHPPYRRDLHPVGLRAKEQWLQPVVGGKRVLVSLKRKQTGAVCGYRHLRVAGKRGGR